MPAPEPKKKRAKQGRPSKKAPPLPDLAAQPSSSSSTLTPSLDRSNGPADSASTQQQTDEASADSGLDASADATADASSDFAIPDWLAEKYSTTAKATPTSAEPPSEPPSTPATTGMTPVPTRMAASAFKPVKRKPAKKMPTESAELDSLQVSDTAMHRQSSVDTGLAGQDMLTSPASDFDLDAALKADAQMTDAALDEAADEVAAALTPQATAAMDTLLSSEASPSPDPYSQTQASVSSQALAADSSLEAGDLSPTEVDRDPQLTPEADAVIDAGVAAATPASQDMPGVLSIAIEEDEGQPRPTDADISVQSFAGNLFCAVVCMLHASHLCSAALFTSRGLHGKGLAWQMACMAKGLGLGFASMAGTRPG